MILLDQIGNEIMLASQLLKTNNMSKIGEKLGYRPILLVTAQLRAVEQGKFTYDKKSDTITISDDVDLGSLDITAGMRELVEILEEFTRHQNAMEKDTSIDELELWLGGTPGLHVQIAAQASDKLATYDHTPSKKDKKSVYTFVTLKENVDKRFGEKQFDAANSKASKLADNN